MTPRAERIWAWIMVGVATLIRLPLVFSSLAYRIDVWRQADTVSIARHFYENGFHLLYPQIYWGGAGPGYVEAEFQLYPFLVALSYRLLGEHLWLARLVSLLFTVPAMLMFHRFARQILSAREALLALGLFAVTSLYLRYSVVVMPEPAAVFFYVTALDAFHRWLERGERRSLALAAAMTALAALVKPTTIHIGLVFLLLIVRRRGVRQLLRAELWLAGLLSLLPAALWYWHARGLYLRHGNTFGVLSGGDSKFGGLQYWLDPAFYQSLLALESRWLLGWLGWVPAALGLRGALGSRRDVLAFGIVTIWIYYLIVARYAGETWGVHYHIYAAPFYAAAMGRGLSWLLDRRPWGPPLAALSVASFLLVAGTIYRGLLQAEDRSVAACGEEVGRIVPSDALLLVSSSDASRERGVPNNYQNPVIFFYARRRGFSLASDWHTPSQVEAFRRRGARFLVITEQELERPLSSYLAKQARQVGPGIERGCAVYQLLDPRR